MDSRPPSPGDIVHVRTRHYVVEDAASGPHGTVVDLACMDDDVQGNRLSALWKLELDSDLVTASEEDIEAAYDEEVEVALWPAS